MLIAVPAVALLVAAFFLTHRSAPVSQPLPTFDHTSADRPAPADAAGTFRAGILGEWMSLDRSLTVTFLAEEVVLRRADGEAEMQPYMIEPAKKIAVYSPAGGVQITAKLGDDGRLYARRDGETKVIVLARPYRGGWHRQGEIVP